MSAVNAWLTAIGDLDETDIASADTSSKLKEYFSIDVNNPLVSTLQNELWDAQVNINEAVKSANLLDSAWPGYTELAKSYLFFCYSVDPNDPVGTFDAYGRFYSALQSAYGNARGCTLNDVVIQSTKRMLFLFSRAAEELKWMSGVLQRIFNSIRSEKPAEGANSKRPVLLFIAGALCRVYFWTDQYSSCSTVFNNIHTASLVMSEHPIAQQIEFRFWLGRYNLNRNNLVLAFKHLHWCYTRCPRQFPNHRVIFKYLLLPSILLGRMPSPALLQAHDLIDPFMPLIYSLKSGSFSGYYQVRNHPWFHKHRLDHLLLRNVPTAIWRRALARAYKWLSNPKQLDFELMAVVMSYSKGLNTEPVSVLEAESFGIACINAGLLKGIDLPATGAFLLRTQDTWPSPRAVFKIMDPNLGEKNEWMNT